LSINFYVKQLDNFFVSGNAYSYSVPNIPVAHAKRATNSLYNINNEHLKKKFIAQTKLSKTVIRWTKKKNVRMHVTF